MHDVVPASQLDHPSRARETDAAWSYPNLCGRLVEVSGCGASATLTMAVGLVLDAQRANEPVAWITANASVVFPPDLDDSGVDLEALAVIRVRDAHTGGRAADKLLRSGAFGLVVLDLGEDDRLPSPLLGRLVRLAQKHDAAVLCLTDKPAAAGSMGSLVSLRVEATRHAMHTPSQTSPLDRLRERASIVPLGDGAAAPDASTVARSTTESRPSVGASTIVPFPGSRPKDQTLARELEGVEDPGLRLFRVELRALKDKRRGPGWHHTEVVRGTSGLR